MMYLRIDLEDRNYFVDIAEKIEQNTAPILRPSKLIKVGQPQPSILLLASKMHEKVCDFKVIRPDALFWHKVYGS